jgi:hypothetical protein
MRPVGELRFLNLKTGKVQTDAGSGAVAAISVPGYRDTARRSGPPGRRRRGPRDWYRAPAAWVMPAGERRPDRDRTVVAPTWRGQTARSTPLAVTEPPPDRRGRGEGRGMPPSVPDMRRTKRIR